ncbi:MAG: MFS transporter [Anaerolineales bacterium]|nr:MFS transporter [Anaerolineales bacterium]
MSSVAIRRLDFRQTFTAFKYRNFRLWFFGQVVSLFGTWMQNTAQGYLVYELTRSPAYLGYVGFAAGLPSWLFMLLGGVAADRISRRNLMVITQTSMMALAFILAGLTFSETVQPWHILLLALGLGIANAFDAPARLALIPELVEREDLTNAIALNGAMFNLATVIGPAAGGMIYAWFGPGWCFTINGLTFVAVIAALLMMNMARPAIAARHSAPLVEIVEGLRFVVQARTVMALIAVVTACSLFGISIHVLMPAWAVNVLGGDATTAGLLRSAQGAGSLVGVLIIASLGRFNYRGKLLTVGTFAFPALLFVLSLTRNLPLSLLTLSGVGAASILIMNLANSLVQSSLPDALRGRVMSIYSLTFFGSMPVGSFLLGQVAEHTSEATALQLSSVLLLLCAALVWLKASRVRKLE